METVPNYWKGVPPGAKIAIASLICGWVLHIAVYFHLFPDDLTDRTFFLQLLVGVGICYGVATGRRWARMLCVFFNIGIVALYALLSLAFVQSDAWGDAGLSALIAGLFAVSALFLLRADSARFFNPHVPPVADVRE